MRPGQRLCLLLFLAFLPWAPACDKGRDRQKEPFARCSRDKRCFKPRICVLQPRLASGVCVHACRINRDCPAGQRCTGRYRPTDQVEVQRFCRQTRVPVGGDCSGIIEGCQAGLQCRHGRTCVRTCQAEADCPADQKCVAIHDRRTFGGPSSFLYHACVKATLPAGQPCGPHRRPLCRRGFRCHRHQCVQTCEADKDCGAGHLCDGEARSKYGAATQRSSGQEHNDFKYCRRAAGLGEPCGHRGQRDVGCTPPGRCYRGRCRKSCSSHEDCADVPGRRQCRQRRSQGKPIQVCL